jgi:hypothetical protein
MEDPKYFECQCHSAEHVLRTWFDDDEDYPCIYMSVFLGAEPWHRRLWLGLKYILGYKCRYGHFDEFLLRPEDADRMIEMLEALKRSKKE